MRFALICLALLVANVPSACRAEETGLLPPGLPALGPARDCSAVLASAAPAENAEAAKLAGAIDPALTGTATQSVRLLQRMRARQVPGVSIALIRNGRLAWAQAFGVRDASTCEPVTPNTAFQAGSISKSLTAFLAMQAVSQGRMSLDQNINDYLIRWKMRPGESAPGNATVTLRQLLNHTAAVSPVDSQGVRPGDPTYDIVQVLRGELPAKGKPVHISGTPGQLWSYSNAGYAVVQLALEDSLKLPFGELAQQRILGPLAMNRSSFDQPPAQPDLAAGHHIGRAFIDKVYHVPELAAGGLWSTPTDLAHYLIAVRNAVRGTDERILPQTFAAKMIEPGMGDWGPWFFNTRQQVRS